MSFKKYAKSNHDDPIMFFDDQTKKSIKEMSEEEIKVGARCFAIECAQVQLKIIYENILKQMMEIHGSE